jgi:hypothetical protein
LAFSHQSHNGEKGNKYDNGAYKDKSHTVILRKGRKNIPQTLAFCLKLQYNKIIKSSHCALSAIERDVVDGRKEEKKYLSSCGVVARPL